MGRRWGVARARRVAWWGLLIALVACVAFAACSSLEPRLDGTKIARAITQSARTQFASAHATIGAARCPADRAQRKGDRFDCHVTIDGQEVRYTVVQIDGHGTVRPTLAAHYVLLAPITDQTRADLRSQGLDDVEVACGRANVWFVQPPAKLQCKITLPNQTTRAVLVSLAADGGVASVLVG